MLITGFWLRNVGSMPGAAWFRLSSSHFHGGAAFKHHPVLFGVVQDTFDEAVRENIEEFDMEASLGMAVMVCQPRWLEQARAVGQLLAYQLILCVAAARGGSDERHPGV
jgi:hypothetical protein